MILLISDSLVKSLFSSESDKLMPRKFVQGSKISKLKLFMAFLLAKCFADGSNAVRTCFINSLASMSKRPTAVLILVLSHNINILQKELISTLFFNGLKTKITDNKFFKW